MKRIILLSALFGLLAFNTSAQTKKEKITAFFKLMKTDDLVNSMVENMISQTFKNLPGAKNPQRDSLYAAYVKEETIA
ncbi:MAG: hypothetical protein H7Z13_15180 [Ferruginibacter sp.]|nr:hypothetical protein [Ferruginibacter sp.]